MTHPLDITHLLTLPSEPKAMTPDAARALIRRAALARDGPGAFRQTCTAEPTKRTERISQWPPK
jgi:hypothetical protein